MPKRYALRGKRMTALQRQPNGDHNKYCRVRKTQCQRANDSKLPKISFARFSGDMFMEKQDKNKADQYIGRVLLEFGGIIDQVKTRSEC